MNNFNDYTLEIANTIIEELDGEPFSDNDIKYEHAMDNIFDAIDSDEHVIYYSKACDLVIHLREHHSNLLGDAESEWEDCGMKFTDIDTMMTQLAYFALRASVERHLSEILLPTDEVSA